MTARKTGWTMKAGGLLVAALLFASAFACYAGTEEDFQAGKKFFQTGDVVGAIAQLRKAADQGHVRAQTLLAYILDISEENEEAVKYYRMAANQGDAEGEFGLGSMLAAGEGVPKNYGEAFKWIKRAAERSYLPAVNALAEAYWTGDLGLGQEGRKDQEQALRWIRQAAEKGHLPSVNALAQAYRNGLLGLAPDTEQAKVWEARAKALAARPGKESKSPKK